MPSVGIAGAGLTGRLLAFALLQKGWQITLFDSDQRTGGQSAAVVAAGMLAPYAELETAEPLVFGLGQRSLELWPQWLAALAEPVFFQQTGTLLIAHRQDRADMERFVSHIRAKLGERAELQSLSAIALADDPVLMARGFAFAVQAGRCAFLAGPLQPRDMASPSTPTLGMPFWHRQSS